MIFSFFKKLLSKNTSIKTELQLNNMSKDALEIYARSLGLELDKRYSKDKLVQQILAEQEYKE